MWILKVMGVTAKVALKYVVVPAIASAAVALAAEGLARQIRAHTPMPADHSGRPPATSRKGLNSSPVFM